MLDDAALSSLLAALFATTNPVGNLALFASMTADRGAAERLRIAWVTALAAAITLVVVAWGGQAALTFFGISIDALRTAGGLILLRIGLNMLINDPSHAQNASEAESAGARQSIAIVPLAIPIVAGPAAMSVVLVAAHEHANALGRLEVSLVALAIGALVGVVFSAAGPLGRLLGESGMGVVTRVMGMLLMAMAVGMLAAGVGALLPGLMGAGSA